MSRLHDIALGFLGSHIRLPVRSQIKWGAGPPDISAGHAPEYVMFTPQWWLFPKTTVRGIVHRPAGVNPNDPDWWGTVALGLRCTNCRKVFFVGEIEDLHHECTLRDHYRCST